MKLNSREQAWQRRNEGKLKKESHPSYKKMQTKKSFEERLKDFKFVDPWSEEGLKIAEENAQKYGRAWWIFQGLPRKYGTTYEPTWIEQFRVEHVEEDV